MSEWIANTTFCLLLGSWFLWRGRFGAFDVGFLVGWVVLMLWFVLAFKEMEMEHQVVIGIICFKDRELINSF